MLFHSKTVELGSITLTCGFEDESGKKSCSIKNDSKTGDWIDLNEEDLHNVRSTAEELWEELEENHGDSE